MKKIKIPNTSKKEKVKFFGTEEAPKIERVNAKIELIGNCEAYIEGCKGVIDYYESHIKLNIGNCSICFFGNRLVIESFILGNVIIKGKIEKIEYC